MKQYAICKRNKKLRYNGKYIDQKSVHSDVELLQLLSAQMPHNNLTRRVKFCEFNLIKYRSSMQFFPNLLFNTNFLGDIVRLLKYFETYH